MKVYNFSRRTVDNEEETYSMTEYELDKKHEDLLLGNFLKRYLELPTKIQKQARMLLRKAYRKSSKLIEFD
jgi:hypothetical protein